MRYRVDTVPLWLQPPYLLGSYAVASAIAGGTSALRHLCRIEVRGEDRFADRGPAIFCSWHDAFIPLVCVVGRNRLRGHVWMNHPDWSMKPTHLILSFMGVERLALGSTGHGGRQAAEDVVAALRAGHSTYVFPDGPAGPRHQLRRGVLHMARESGVPIVAVRFTTEHAWVFQNTWDRKRVPRPLSRIVVEFGAPLRVTDDNLEDCERRLVAAL